MKYFILGKPYSKEDFFLSDAYKGIERSFFPIQEGNKNIDDFIGKYFSNMVDNFIPNWEIAREIILGYNQNSKESFDIVLALGDSDENILAKESFLGYDVVEYNSSLILHTFKKVKNSPIKIELLVNKYEKYLNKYYLFESLEIAKKFVIDLIELKEDYPFGNIGYIEILELYDVTEKSPFPLFNSEKHKT